MPILENLKSLVEVAFKNIKLTIGNMFNKTTNNFHIAKLADTLIIVPDKETAKFLEDAIKRHPVESQPNSVLTESQPTEPSCP